MKKLAGLLLVLGACSMPPYWEMRDRSRTELEAAPLDSEFKAAIISDVRIWRELRKDLARGLPQCKGLTYSQSGLALCRNDKSEFTIFHFPQANPDLPGRIEETAYFCRKEGTYFYKHTSGQTRREVWLGPFRINRTAKSLDEVELP